MTKVNSMQVDISWQEGFNFQAKSPNQVRMTMDGDARAGLSPMEARPASPSTCIGIDVVMILQSMRARLTLRHELEVLSSLKIRV